MGIHTMKTIAIFGGTSEGRLLAEALAGNSALQCHVYTATEHGASLFPRAGNVIAHSGRLDGYAMKAELAAIRPELVIDATHPYATAVAENLRRTSDSLRLTCIRIARQDTSPENAPGDVDSVIVSTASEAAAFLNGKTGRILLTTGSRDLQVYTAMDSFRERVYARVLPKVEILEKCRLLDYDPGHIVAMQGPFSQGMNEQLIRDLDIRWLVTKEAGMAGGYPEKCEAALALGCGLVIIGRPRKYEDAVSLDAVIRMLAEQGDSADSIREDPASEEEPVLQVQKEPEDEAPGTEGESVPGGETERCAAIIGIGPGDVDELTVRAFSRLKEADLLVGSGTAVDKMLSAVRRDCPEANPDLFVSVRPGEAADYLRSHPAYLRPAVLFSGDIASCPDAGKLREALDRIMKTEIYSGISPEAWFVGHLGISWQDVTHVDLKGRNLDPVPVIRGGHFTLLTAFCESSLSELSERLVLYGLRDVRITVGSRLSSSDEAILTGTAESFIGRSCDAASLILIWNPHPVRDHCGFGEDDELFVTSRVTDRPVSMTKREIRSLALSMLRLGKSSVLYDIGAGNGSLAVEAARVLTEGHVFAIDERTEAVELMRTNQIRWSASNMAIIEGHAPEAMSGLPAPSHAFIGGCPGLIAECVEDLRRRNEQVRIVIAGMTEEAVREIWEIRNKLGNDCEIRVTELQVIRSGNAGDSHVRCAENPVVLAEIFPRAGEEG